MGLAKLKRILAMAMLSSIAFAAYADDAPVYEVDNYPPPFDGQQAEPAPVSADSGGLAPEVTPEANQQLVHEQPQARQEAFVPQPVAAPPPVRPLTMEQRVQRAEQQIKNLQQSNSLSKTDELQKEVQSLRGQVEDMSHQLQQAQTQLKAMFADLDSRIAKSQVAGTVIRDSENANVSNVSKKPPSKRLSSASTVSNISEPNKKMSSQPNIAEEQQIYQTAYDLIKAKKYNDAISTLQKMLQKYPSGQSAAIAHYWLGELYGLVNKSEQSMSEFSMVVKKYPSSSRAPDAQLKLGLIYAGQFKWPEAKVAFKGILSRYPGTPTARVASEQLKQIKKAGH